jgi:hypothetical protein
LQADSAEHALPSSHAVPSGAFTFEQRPVAGSHVPALWHGSAPGQTTGLRPTQTPLAHVSEFVHALPSLHFVPSERGVPPQVPSWHLSDWVQVLPSSHAVSSGSDVPTQDPLRHMSIEQGFCPPHFAPSGATGYEQVPVAGSQLPARWHASGGAQTTACPEQIPEWQALFAVHRLPSSHDVPSGPAAYKQVPVAGSQTPAPVWHGPGGGQTTGLPTQDPLRHESDRVQALPSLQLAPSGATGCVQASLAGSQVPAMWHESSGLHTTAAPEQVPPWHASFVVQKSPSLQEAPSGAGAGLAVHAPVAGSHRLGWQASLAGQTTTSDVPSRIETWLLSDRDTVKSGLPSRLKSEIAKLPVPLKSPTGEPAA